MGMMKDGWDTHFQDDVVRHALTKNIGEKFPEVVDEVSRAFADTVAEHTKANGKCYRRQRLKLSVLTRTCQAGLPFPR